MGNEYHLFQQQTNKRHMNWNMKMWNAYYSPRHNLAGLIFHPCPREQATLPAGGNEDFGTNPGQLASFWWELGTGVPLLEFCLFWHATKAGDFERTPLTYTVLYLLALLTIKLIIVFLLWLFRQFVILYTLTPWQKRNISPQITDTEELPITNYSQEKNSFTYLELQCKAV